MSPSVPDALANSVRVYFIGAIKNSQVAINCGTVTQTMVEPFKHYLDGPGRGLLEPDGGSVSVRSEPPRTPEHQPQPTVEVEAPISAETFSRTYLRRMLYDLQQRIPETGLPSHTRSALRHATGELLTALDRTPVDMAEVEAKHNRVEEILAGALQVDASRRFPDDPRSVQTRGGAA